MSYFPADRLAGVNSRLRWRNLRNLRPSVFAIPGNTRARDWRTFQPHASFNLPKRARPNYWRNIPITLFDRASCPQTRKQSRNALVESWHAFRPKPLKLALMGLRPARRGRAPSPHKARHRTRPVRFADPGIPNRVFNLTGWPDHLL